MPVDTGGDRPRTGSNATSHGLAYPLIDLAVAIVINTITDLCARGTWDALPRLAVHAAAFGRAQAATPAESVPSPSSICPLQLSSRPLQTSGLGVPGTHCWGWPFTQAATVRAQAPIPQESVPSPSSICPLQSLSTPSQI